MGAELLLTQQTRGAPTRRRTPTPPTTLRKRSKSGSPRRTSLAFPKDSLQRALELLAEDIGVEIVIEGRELQPKASRKTSRFAARPARPPAGEILVEILRRANPDRTAEGPADPRQKLVYVDRRGGGSAAAGLSSPRAPRPSAAAGHCRPCLAARPSDWLYLGRGSCRLSAIGCQPEQALRCAARRMRPFWPIADSR